MYGTEEFEKGKSEVIITFSATVMPATVTVTYSIPVYLDEMNSIVTRAMKIVQWHPWKRIQNTPTRHSYETNISKAIDM